MADENTSSAIDSSKEVLVRAIPKDSVGLLDFTAQHRKISVPSADIGTYDQFNPSPLPDVADQTGQSVSITNLQYIYLTNAVVHKAINIKANRLMGKGFNLLPSDHKEADQTLAESAADDCMAFLKRIKYRTFFRQSCINAYTSGNEWTENIYNQFKHLVSLAHGDFQTIDYRRNFINNKVLLGSDGTPVGYWQYIADLSQLYHTINAMYGELSTYENMLTSKMRLQDSRDLKVKVPNINETDLKDKTIKEITDEKGEVVAVMTTKPNYMFLKKEEISHLSFNNLNDNPLGVSMILPAYNALNHLEQVMYASAEAINDMGYPKPDVTVGDAEHAADETMMNAAESLVTNPVRKEAFVHDWKIKLAYLQPAGMGNGGIGDYPEWFFTEVAIGLRMPKELLTGAGEANRAGQVQASNDFDRDCEADRNQLEDYILEILSRYLISRGYEEDAYGNCIYTPIIQWEALITEDQALREKMTLEKWNADLLTFNETRVALGLDEIEDLERGDKYKSELSGQEQDAVLNPTGTPLSDLTGKDETGTVKVGNPEKKQSDEQADINAAQTPESTQEPEVLAQHALKPADELNPQLNKINNTEGVNYKKVAQKSVGTKIKTVSKADARKIRDAIVNGEATRASAKSIKAEVAKIGDYDPAHTKMVLVTEQKNLAEHGSLENAMKKGYKFKKWDATLDKDTSALCKALDGQVVPIDKEFSISYKDESGKERTWKGMAPAAHPNCRAHLLFQNEEK